MVLAPLSIVLNRVFNVSELNARIKDRLATDLRLSDLCARGELSNVVNHRSGHRYFTLRDSDSQISCVLFKNHGRRLDFELENGQNVLIFGDVSFYHIRGRVQIIVRAIQKDLGLGARHQEFEALKRKLGEEGLFDEARKSPLPLYPEKIGVVTSPDGAALKDVLKVLGSYPARILLSPAQVQGESAPKSISFALTLLRGKADVAIVCRGGGSVEDLWPFNSEIVARAISRLDCPVVSAVGHETDVTIADFVADLRAPTPSAAAEMVKPDVVGLKEDLKVTERRMARSLAIILERRKNRLARLESGVSYNAMSRRLEEMHRPLNVLSGRLFQAEAERVELMTNSLDVAAGKLNELSPLATLTRGYAIAIDTADNKPIRSVLDVSLEEEIDVFLTDGRLRCSVIDKNQQTRF